LLRGLLIGLVVDVGYRAGLTIARVTLLPAWS
jgi:hypothetical protein